MGSGEVTTPVMVSATVGLQKPTYFEMRYAVMFDEGQTARVHVTEAGCLRAADLCYAHLWLGGLLDPLIVQLNIRYILALVAGYVLIYVSVTIALLLQLSATQHALRP